MSYRITITDEASARLRAFPAASLRATGRALDSENEQTVSSIIERRLSFPKTGPSTLEGLRVQSGRLRRSVRRIRAIVQGNEVHSAIGANVVYAGVHEFGGTFTRTTRPGAVRLRTNARGELLRQGGGRLAVFARRTHKRARTVIFAGGHSYTVTYPERAYIRRTLEARLPQYKRAIEAAIIDAWNGNP